MVPLSAARPCSCDQKKIRSGMMLICGFLIFGCATTYNYEKELDLFVGLPLGHLESTWGKPQGISQLPDGRTMVEYITFRTTEQYVGKPYVPEYIASGFIPPEHYIQKPDAYKKALWCRTRFIVNRNGIVDSWSHEGNDCKK